MSYYFVYMVFWPLSKLPERDKRWVASFIYFVLYKVLKYRVAVVRQNLKNSFKSKTDSELLEIERKFYRHLSDVFIETINLVSISEKKLRQKMNFLNVDQIENYTKDRSWICAMAHYGSWEYTTLWGRLSEHSKNFAVYRPLHNKGVDRYYHKVRSRFDMQLLPMEEVGREIIRNRRLNQAVSIGMISDQVPPPSNHMNWFAFLGQVTPFFTGMEKLAVKFGMPVAFLHIDKFERGRYVAWFEVIYDGEEKVEQGEITKRYIKKMEDMIRKRPELWMWSHKRWKYQYPEDDAEEILNKAYSK